MMNLKLNELNILQCSNYITNNKYAIKFKKKTK